MLDSQSLAGKRNSKVLDRESTFFESSDVMEHSLHSIVNSSTKNYTLCRIGNKSSRLCEGIKGMLHYLNRDGIPSTEEQNIISKN